MTTPAEKPGGPVGVLHEPPRSAVATDAPSSSAERASSTRMPSPPAYSAAPAASSAPSATAPFRRRRRRVRCRASSISASRSATRSASERWSASVCGGGATTFTAELLCDCASISSVMRIVKVDRQDPTELYQQVAAEIRRAIADGEAKPGERLPPACDLAAVLEVNTNTVLRALRELRERRPARVPPRPGNHGRRHAGEKRRHHSGEGSRRVRASPRLPRRRAGRDRQGGELSRSPADRRWVA